MQPAWEDISLIAWETAWVIVGDAAFGMLIETGTTQTGAGAKEQTFHATPAHLYDK